MGRKRVLPIEDEIGCINPDCEYYKKPGSVVQAANSGKNKGYRCNACRKYFSETYGTIFYKTQTDVDKIVQVLKALAEGNTIRGCARIFGVDKDSVIRWLVRAGEHCEEIEKILVNKFEFTQVQLDEMWTFIVKKTTHKVVRNEKSRKPQN
ncbi:MAG: hypothetical protein U9Q83_05405 [Bacteroidota bacterium]|nr:hypothetical protein [Bacteroidota bacterium]